MHLHVQVDQIRAIAKRIDRRTISMNRLSKKTQKDLETVLGKIAGLRSLIMEVRSVLYRLRVQMGATPNGSHSLSVTLCLVLSRWEPLSVCHSLSCIVQMGATPNGSHSLSVTLYLVLSKWEPLSVCHSLSFVSSLVSKWEPLHVLLTAVSVQATRGSNFGGHATGCIPRHCCN